MDGNEIITLAEELYNAQINCVPVTALSDRYPDITIDDSYEIAMEVVNIKKAHGLSVIGKKIGLTNKAIRDQIGVHEPDYGIITSEGILTDGGVLEMERLIAPRAEPEIAFIMDRDITPDQFPLKPCDICYATRGIAAAIEIVDSRFIDWKIRIQDTIADAASYAAFVLSGRIVPIDSLDLSIIGMCAFKNGELVHASCSGNVMGNPLNSMTWLVNTLLSRGLSLKAGEVVLSGSFTPVFSIGAGDSIYIKFDHLGDISIRAV